MECLANITVRISILGLSLGLDLWLGFKLRVKIGSGFRIGLGFTIMVRLGSELWLGFVSRLGFRFRVRVGNKSGSDLGWG